MFGFAKLKEHRELVTRMADALSVDLEEAEQRGTLTPEDVDVMVERCVGCLEAEACKCTLAATAPGSATQAPDYCRNKDQFVVLRRN
ncbi:DUF6455 family protein [Actibacterium sp.]|uniref:DUF6455 family protein n=1 Tax=Actibacterium sp. TaxID=1872125 RepID=UPI0035658255